MFVGNLSYYTNQNDLADLLADAGQIVDIYLPTDRNSGKPRGFAFVEFSNEDEAQACIDKFNEHELDGRKLRINEAEDRPAPRGRSFRPSGPPGGGGGGGDGGDFFAAKRAKPKGSRRGKRGKKRSL